MANVAPNRIKELGPTKKMCDILVYKKPILGSGAFGSVFMGELDGNLCAVKVLNPLGRQIQTSLPASSKTVQHSALERFKRECDLLEKFDHDKIVHHIASRIDPESNLPILVLELLDCSLTEYLEKSTTDLQMKTKISLCCDVASALAYLHDSPRNIVHRDLCSDNILLRLTDPIPVAKVGDFGMSRIIDCTNLSHSLTAMGHRVGYMPPEAPSADYDSSLDIFMFGAIMIQIVSKIHHIESEKHRVEHFKAISKTHPLYENIANCLHEDKEMRPKAFALHRSLCHIFEGCTNPHLSGKDLETTAENALPLFAGIQGGTVPPPQPPRTNVHAAAHPYASMPAGMRGMSGYNQQVLGSLPPHSASVPAGLSTPNYQYPQQPPTLPSGLYTGSDVSQNSCQPSTLASGVGFPGNPQSFTSPPTASLPKGGSKPLAPGDTPLSENDEPEDQLDGMIENEQPLVRNEDPQNEQQHNGEPDNEEPEANPGEPEIPRFKKTGQLASTAKSIQRSEMLKLRRKVKLILHTCNDNEQRAVLKTLSPLSLKGFENQSFVVWDPQGLAHIGKFAGQVVAVLFTEQADKARGGLQLALKKYEMAQAIIGVGVGYGKDRKTFHFADVMVSKHIENAVSLNIEHSEDKPMKVNQRGERQPVNTELLSHFISHKLMWEDTFKVTQSEEGQTSRSSQVHFGTIVSGPIPLKSKALKEKLMALMDKTVGGEMEGWVLLGMIEEMQLHMKRQISVIVVKGVADYGDIGKDDGWQLTAAMAAVDFVRHCIESSGPAANYAPAP